MLCELLLSMCIAPTTLGSYLVQCTPTEAVANATSGYAASCVLPYFDLKKLASETDILMILTVISALRQWLESIALGKQRSSSRLVELL